MRKEYNEYANKHNIPNLELYTQLLGIFYGTSGLNLLLCFFQWKYTMVSESEYAVLFLMLSIAMFIGTPIMMKDERRVERDLFAVIGAGIVHGFFTIPFIVWLRFKVLIWVYVIEILIVIFLSIRNYRINHGKWFKKKSVRIGNVKKEYNKYANKHNIPNLKLYTRLLGIFYGTLGLNFLLCCFQWRHTMKSESEYAAVFFMLGIVMFMYTPVVMLDERRSHRDLSAVIVAGIIHGFCTIPFIVWLRFKVLLLLYVAEILIVIFLSIRNYKINHGK